jgi:thymidine kinase
MAKLYFRYGAMGSAKTLNLLAVRHNYEVQGKRVLLIKPCVDVRFGQETVRSRAGLEYPADILLESDDRLADADLQGLHCILVDECQFLTRELVDHLREVTRTHNIPIIAYGLRTDFRADLFEGSKRLMEVADSIEEIKTTCRFCNRKAVFNLRHDSQGQALVDGPTLLLGADTCYSPTCYPCYYGKIREAQDYCQRKVESTGLR